MENLWVYSNPAVTIAHLCCHMRPRIRGSLIQGSMYSISPVNCGKVQQVEQDPLLPVAHVTVTRPHLASVYHWGHQKGNNVVTCRP